MFNKAILKDSKKKKNWKQCIKMQSISAFLDIRKVANFWRKNADVSRPHEACHVVYTFFRSSLGSV